MRIEKFKPFRHRHVNKTFLQSSLRKWSLVAYPCACAVRRNNFDHLGTYSVQRLFKKYFRRAKLAEKRRTTQQAALHYGWPTAVLRDVEDMRVVVAEFRNVHD